MFTCIFGVKLDASIRVIFCIVFNKIVSWKRCLITGGMTGDKFLEKGRKRSPVELSNFKGEGGHFSSSQVLLRIIKKLKFPHTQIIIPR